MRVPRWPPSVPGRALANGLRSGPSSVNVRGIAQSRASARRERSASCGSASAQTRDRLSELRLRAGADLGGQCLCLREEGERGLPFAGELLGFRAAALQDAEAELVVRGAQQALAVVERETRRLVFSLPGVDP